MNRQVGPSIVLSVFIVCFFAVALFRHDPRRLTRDGTQKQASRRDVRPRPPSGAPQRDSPNGLAASSTGRATKPRRDIDPESTRRDGQLPVTSSEPLPSLIRAASVRSQGASKQPGTKANRDDQPPKNPIEREPRSAFTVVERDESIEDVALRIYGSTVAVETLWRANRDLLPNKDSALSQGTILRTPTMR